MSLYFHSDGPSVSGRLLANLCGNITGRTYSSVSGSITVVFSSDSGISEKGFYATWTEGEARKYIQTLVTCTLFSPSNAKVV